MKRSIFTYRSLLVSILLLWQGALCAQENVIIQGDAPFAKSEEIRAIGFNDLLNRQPVILGTAKIDKQGNFKLKCSIKEIQTIQLAIRNAKAELFIAPGRTYNFHINTDTVLFAMVDPEKYGGFLQITTNKIDTNDLNYKINRFSYFYEQALDQYAFALTVDKDKAAYDSITFLLKKYFPIRYNPLNFYESYLYYAYGLLDLLFYDKYPDTIYHRYFDNDYILYNNPAYMSMFYSSYTGYLYNSRHISKDLLTKTINEKPDYLTLFNEAGRDPMLTNERLRELVIILNVSEFYGNEDFDQQNIIQLLKYIKDYTHFPEHAIIVEHTLDRIETMNQPVEPITMTNLQGKSMTFGTIGDKPIYVQVFQTDCVDCIREMLLIKEFYKLYGDSIEFVSLNIDADKSRYKAFCRKYGNQFTWSVLYFEKNYDWLTAFGIETLPDYFILDKDGTLLIREAPAPEKGLVKYLMQRYPKVEVDDENPMFIDRN